MSASKSGNFETEGRAEIGGEGSEASEPFVDTTSGLNISSAEIPCIEGQPNKLLEAFCFTGELKHVAVGVPGREMGNALLRAGGCCGVTLTSEAWHTRGGCEDVLMGARIGRVGALCEAENAEGDGASNAVAGIGDVDEIVGLAKGDPKADVAVPWSPMFATSGADIDAPKGEEEVLASAGFCTANGIPIAPEA